MGLTRGQYDQAVASLRSQMLAGVEPVSFDADHWVAHWIETPALALGGLMPIELLHTSEGWEQVIKLLMMTQSGGHA